MKKHKTLLPLSFILFTLALLLSCTKPNPQNPFDPNSNIKLSNLKYERLGLNKIKLSWDKNYTISDGSIIINRKIGNEAWQSSYATINCNLTQWIDDYVDIYPSVSYKLRLYFKAQQIYECNISINDYLTIYEEGICDLIAMNGLDVKVAGNHAYIANDDAGLIIIDISDENNPMIVATCNTPGSADEIFILDQYAYIADGASGLQIINIQNPSNPWIEGTCSTPDYANSIQVSGNYAFLTCGTGGLRIIDVSEPNNPFLANYYDPITWMNGIYIQFEYAYVIGRYSGLLIIDISDPLNLWIEGTCSTPDYANSIQVSGNYAYIAVNEKGIQIIDITNPSNPQKIDHNNISYDGWHISIHNNYVLIGNYGFLVINITNPFDIFVVGQYELPYLSRDVIINKNFFYLTDCQENFRILSISL
ncbi:MAG: hypothetical protein KAW88_01355 [Candidatus Cloacimonetes bacterium]|nr:hypothetical protein [Candidatus Cloacimonadota bacterium]